MFNTRFNPASSSPLICKDASLAQQQFKDEVDINTILARFKVTQELPVAGARVPVYGDFSEVVDYRTAMDSIKVAKDAFMELPAKLRARFENSPQAYLEFCSDPANRDEMIRLGLVVPTPEPKAPEPTLVRIVPDSPKE